MTNTNEVVNEAYSTLKDQEYALHNRSISLKGKIIGTSCVFISVGFLLILVPLFFMFSGSPSETTEQVVSGVRLTQGIGLLTAAIASIILVIAVEWRSKPVLSADKVNCLENFYDALSQHINKTYGVKLNRAQITRAYKEVNGLTYQKDDASPIMRLYIVQYNNKWALLSQGSEIPRLV